MKVNKFKYIVLFLTLATVFLGCESNNLLDTNTPVVENNWLYANSAKAIFEIKEVNHPYTISFKFRHTSAYKYANLFVVMRLKGNGLNKSTRYEFKLAKSDGEWLGKGSGDIYTYSFPLLTNYSFTKLGKYQIEIEQNMRDNPLIGISDVGIVVSK